MKENYIILRTSALVVCFVIALSLLVGCGKNANADDYLSYNESVLNVEWLGLFTGADSYNQTDAGYLVGGTDLGFPCYNSTDDTMYLFFGDTFQNASSMTGYWRSNVMAKSTDYNLSDGLTIDSFLSNENGIAGAVIDGHHINEYEMTKIPTGCIEVDGTLYMFYFSIRTWSPEQMNYCGAVKSLDNGVTWERVYDMTWVDHAEGGYSGDIQELVNQDIDLVSNVGDIDITQHVGNNFTQIFPIDGKDGYIYILGEGEYRSSGIRMGRVKRERIENFEEYEYFNGYVDGQPEWLKGSEGLQAIESNKKSFLISDFCSEQSCMYNDYLGKWMIVYLINKADGIVYRDAENIFGPYSEPKVIVPYDYPFENGGSGIYAGFVHEQYTEENGKVFYMILSQWNPIYNSSLVRVTLK